MADSSSDSDLEITGKPKQQPGGPENPGQESKASNIYLSSSEDSDNEGPGGRGKTETGTSEDVSGDAVGNLAGGQSLEKKSAMGAAPHSTGKDSSDEEDGAPKQGQNTSQSGEKQPKDTTLEDLGLDGSSSDDSDSENGTDVSKAKPSTGLPAGLSDSDSDSDGEAAPQKPAEAPGSTAKSSQVAELFGSDLDDSDEEGEGGSASGAGVGGARGGDADPMAAEEEAPLVELDLDLPELPRPPAGAQVFISKLPNVLGLKTQPFDQASHDAARERDEFKLTANIMRWRFRRDREGRLVLDDQGRPARDTNTRLVKWSDGSLTLLVGDEAFDAAAQDLQHAYLFAHQQPGAEGGSTCLECQAPAPARLLFRPASLQSAAHRQLTLKVRARNRREGKLKRHQLAANPELEQALRAKATEDLLKQERRRQRDYARTGGRAGAGGAGAGARMSRDYLEGGADGYDGVSLKALKKQTMSGAGGGGLGDLSESSGDDDGDWEARRERQLLQAKRARQSKAGGGDGDEDDSLSDSDADYEFEKAGKKKGPAAGGGGKRARAADSFSSSSDDDLGGGAGGGPAGAGGAAAGAAAGAGDSDSEDDSPVAAATGKKARQVLADSDSD